MDDPTARSAGDLLREWRGRRRVSQLDLAAQAGVSSRHLSFVETGRARAGRGLLLRLAEHLDLPLRERNRLLLAGGFAPVYPRSPLSAPHMAPVREAVGKILEGHEPYPALAVDRLYNAFDSNRTARALLGYDVAPELLVPPANTLRVSLHPAGFAPRIANLAEWRAHLLGRLRRQVAAMGDAELADLYEELLALPRPDREPQVEPPGPSDVVVPLRLRYQDRELSFFTTAATIATPLDVTAAEIMVESFFPADAETRTFLHRTRLPERELPQREPGATVEGVPSPIQESAL